MVEVYQDHINQKYKTNFKMPVVYYSTLMSVAYGGSGKEAGRDRIEVVFGWTCSYSAKAP